MAKKGGKTITEVKRKWKELMGIKDVGKKAGSTGDGLRLGRRETEEMR